MHQLYLFGFQNFIENQYIKITIFIWKRKLKNYLTKNYINIPLKNLNLRFRSTSNEYIEKLSKKIIKEKFDLVEVHNRPLVLLKLMDIINTKFIMYYHNDPLSMSGSKLISQRKEILNRVDKIVFISNWVKKRFFENLDEQDDKTEIIYHSVYKRKKKQK